MVNEARTTFFRTAATQTAQPVAFSPGNQATLSSLGYNTDPAQRPQRLRS
jgi:hypothetical protein